MPLWQKLIATPKRRNHKEVARCAQDIALAASFVKSLETQDRTVNVELHKLAVDLERIAGRLSRNNPAAAN